MLRRQFSPQEAADIFALEKPIRNMRWPPCRFVPMQPSQKPRNNKVQQLESTMPTQIEAGTGRSQADPRNSRCRHERSMSRAARGRNPFALKHAVRLGNGWGCWPIISASEWNEQLKRIPISGSIGSSGIDGSRLNQQQEALRGHFTRMSCPRINARSHRAKARIGLFHSKLHRSLKMSESSKQPARRSCVQRIWKPSKKHSPLSAFAQTSG